MTKTITSSALQAAHDALAVHNETLRSLLASAEFGLRASQAREEQSRAEIVQLEKELTVRDEKLAMLAKSLDTLEANYGVINERMRALREEVRMGMGDECRVCMVNDRMREHDEASESGGDEEEIGEDSGFEDGEEEESDSDSKSEKVEEEEKAMHRTAELRFWLSRSDDLTAERNDARALNDIYIAKNHALRTENKALWAKNVELAEHNLDLLAANVKLEKEKRELETEKQQLVTTKQELTNANSQLRDEVQKLTAQQKRSQMLEKKCRKLESQYADICERHRFAKEVKESWSWASEVNVKDGKQKVRRWHGIGTYLRDVLLLFIVVFCIVHLVLLVRESVSGK